MFKGNHEIFIRILIYGFLNFLSCKNLDLFTHGPWIGSSFTLLVLSIHGVL